MQNYELKTKKIRDAFSEDKKQRDFSRRLEFSWTEWPFGGEPLEASCERLKRHGVNYIELSGLGHNASEVNNILRQTDMKVSGVCGMFSPEYELASPNPTVRQKAVDYIRRELTLCQAVGATYLLLVPGCVGRTVPFDDMEMQRSAETLRSVADDFVNCGIQCAMEVIQHKEVSLVKTVSEALAYIKEVNHPGIQGITGDMFHMQVEEFHMGEAIMQAGDALINFHVADSTRRTLGSGSLDLDTVIRALYLIGYNTEKRFVTAELMAKPGQSLDDCVKETVAYFRLRENAVIAE
ncbi:MAG: sugar phosphate isomerase/epimerase [Defluviitaleaceae bacterium]|nr:sugar phosphate isomerase/epimerase [Defluviitaleaceae bacterium]